MMYLHPEPGVTYRHTKTGNLYTVEGILPIKINSEWDLTGAVIYMCDESRESFVRLTPDFQASFDYVVDETP